TTGFLSRSRSMVSSAPPEISRARCAANRTRSKRLETLSTQSSTVTRAMDTPETESGWERGELGIGGGKVKVSVVPGSPEATHDKSLAAHAGRLDRRRGATRRIDARFQ